MENLNFHSIVFIDIDGTLSDRFGNILNSTKIAIQTAISKGYLIVLSTGAMFPYALHTLKKLEINLNLPLITFNGAFIAFANNISNPIYSKPISNKIFHELINYILDECKNHNLTYNDFNLFCYDACKLYIMFENNMLSEYLTRTNVNYEKIDTFLNLNESLKVLLLTEFNTAYKLKPIKQKLEEKFSEKFIIVNSFPNYIEINDKSVNKGEAVKKVISHFNINFSNTFAIGDSYNDIFMFKAVNHSIAMGQSDEIIKQHAKFITKSFEDDGIYHAFFNYIFKI